MTVMRPLEIEDGEGRVTIMHFESEKACPNVQEE